MSHNAITGNACQENEIGIEMDEIEGSTVIGNTFSRGEGLTTNYTSTQHTIQLVGTDNKYNLIAYNNIMGKNYTSEGGSSNTFTGNKYN